MALSQRERIWIWVQVIVPILLAIGVIFGVVGLVGVVVERDRAKDGRCAERCAPYQYHRPSPDSCVCHDEPSRRGGHDEEG